MITCLEFAKKYLDLPNPSTNSSYKKMVAYQTLTDHSEELTQEQYDALKYYIGEDFDPKNIPVQGYYVGPFDTLTCDHELNGRAPQILHGPYDNRPTPGPNQKVWWKQPNGDYVEA